MHKWEAVLFKWYLQAYIFWWGGAYSSACDVMKYISESDEICLIFTSVISSATEQEESTKRKRWVH